METSAWTLERPKSLGYSGRYWDSNPRNLPACLFSTLAQCFEGFLSPDIAKIGTLGWRRSIISYSPPFLELVFGSWKLQQKVPFAWIICRCLSFISLAFATSQLESPLHSKAHQDIYKNESKLFGWMPDRSSASLTSVVHFTPSGGYEFCKSCEVSLY